MIGKLGQDWFLSCLDITDTVTRRSPKVAKKAVKSKTWQIHLLIRARILLNPA